MKWQNNPFIRLVIPFVLGMMGAMGLVGHVSLSALFILCCAALALQFFLIRRKKGSYKDSTFGITATAFAFLCGMTLYTRKHHSVAQGLPTDSTHCAGILSEPPAEKARSWALNLQQANGTHILLYIGKKSADSLRIQQLHIGDTVLAHTLHQNATDATDDETFRPFYRHLFCHGICATAYAPPHQWTVRPRHDSPHPFLLLRGLQMQMHRIYDDHGISGEAGSIVEAMTIGHTAHLSPSIRQNYAASGVSHVLAMSGFHVGILLVLLQTLFIRGLVAHRWRWVSDALTILALWAFAIIAGLSSSLTRATLMSTILLLGQSFGQELLSIDSFAVALLIMLCLNPLQLNDVGFQLSFTSVASICVFSSPILHLLPTRHTVLRFLWSLVAISFICSITTTPLVAHHFGRLPLLAIASNLAATPFVYLILWGSVLWWAFLWCAPAANLLTTLLLRAADAMNGIVGTIAALPYSTIEWHPGTLATSLCYVALLIIVFITSKIKKQ